MYHLDFMKKKNVQSVRRNVLNSLIAVRQSNVVKKYENYIFENVNCEDTVKN